VDPLGFDRVRKRRPTDLIDESLNGLLPPDSYSLLEGMQLSLTVSGRVTNLEPLADDPKLSKLRAALDRRVGEAQLPELIRAVDAEVRFSWIMLGREPRSSKELLMVYAGILAHGTALSASETARMIRSCPQPLSVSTNQCISSNQRRPAGGCYTRPRKLQVLDSKSIRRLSGAPGFW